MPSSSSSFLWNKQSSHHISVQIRTIFSYEWFSPANSCQSESIWLCTLLWLSCVNHFEKLMENLLSTHTHTHTRIYLHCVWKVQNVHLFIQNVSLCNYYYIIAWKKYNKMENVMYSKMVYFHCTYIRMIHNAFTLILHYNAGCFIVLKGWKLTR